MNRFDDVNTPEYDAFVDKFKPKRTTDDCFTPDAVYEAVKDYVCDYYGVNPAVIRRPFWPGEDYQAVNYEPDCVVVDNPPFSILAKITRWYTERGVKFFLFCPSLTAFGGAGVDLATRVICDNDIIYGNGAVVRTSFMTNLDRDCGIAARTAPDLSKRVNEICEKLRKEKVKELPKYTYPDNIVTAAMIQRYAKYGVEYAVKSSECVRVSCLDAQKAVGKTIFGAGLLLSERAAAERAAAERAAAERAAAHVWELSERELEIVKGLGE